MVCFDMVQFVIVWLDIMFIWTYGIYFNYSTRWQFLTNLFSFSHLLSEDSATSTYIEDITRWCEDMNLYFRVAKQYFMNECSEWVKYCFCHEKIKFISSSHRVMFFLSYRQNDIDKIIEGITKIMSSINSRVRLWKINH